MTDKLKEYSTKIIKALNKEIFNEESENKIEATDLHDSTNMMLFFIALSNVVPAHIHNHFFKKKLKSAEYQELINLYLKKIKDEKENS